MPRKTPAGDNIRLNKTYNDPTADVIIVSNDNVGFKIHSFYLRALR